MTDLTAFENWDDKTKAEVAQRLQSAIDNPPQVWFCKGGWECDGKPHDGYPYPHARASQRPPRTNWDFWFIMAGRGFGKTRTGGEFVRAVGSKEGVRTALVARTASDARDTMIEGESGIEAICERAKVHCKYEPSKRKVTIGEGGTLHVFSAEEPDRLRGPQHHFFWGDEPAHWDNIDLVWANLLLGLRLGKHPRGVLTSTPMPTKWVKERVKDPRVVVTRGSTYDNLENLAPTFQQTVLEAYEGTRLGRQELNGEILEDVEGALWDADMIAAAHNIDTDLLALRAEFAEVGEFGWDKIVVAVDPAGTANKKSDETGIIVVARRGKEFYVLADYTGKYSPDGWAKKAIQAFKKWSADRVVVEKNYGGDMVTVSMRNQDEYLPIKTVTSRRGKEIRAEPVVGLYEQGRVKHFADLVDLETEQMQWVPGVGDSPNRVDALVHGVTDLMGNAGVAKMASPRSINAKERGRTTRPGYSTTPGGVIVPRPGRIYRP